MRRRRAARPRYCRCIFMASRPTWSRSRGWRGGAGLRVIEDCAQSHGARYRGRTTGGIGDIGCFSFYPTKNLGALGDAGMVATDDPALAAALREIREYGWRDRYISARSGSTRGSTRSRPRSSPRNCPISRRTMRAGRESRRATMRVLRGCRWTLPSRRPECSHVFHQYVIRTRGGRPRPPARAFEPGAYRDRHPLSGPGASAAGLSGRLAEFPSGLPETTRVARQS